jgi:hypothetical protein
LTFVIVCGILVYFSRFGILYQEKSGNPGSNNVKLGSGKQRRRRIDIFPATVTRDRFCYNFLNIFASKKISKKLAFLTQKS